MAWRRAKSQWRRYGSSDWGFPRYVSVAALRAKAARRFEALKRKGFNLDPVRIESSRIARTFWGRAWCGHLESHSDFSNRLPRGRSYVRNGSVCDLKIEPGRVTSRVAGNDLYEVTIAIKKLPAPRWAAIRKKCAGGIASLIELLQGKLSAGVMKIITDRKDGLFPRPAEIEMSCSCPDWATMCKHVAATLYGVGARLDDRPELLFVLRGVDSQDLLSERAFAKLAQKGAIGAGAGRRRASKPQGKAARAKGGKPVRAGATGEEDGEIGIAESDLSGIFGVEIAVAPPRRKRKENRKGRQISHGHGKQKSQGRGRIR